MSLAPRAEPYAVAVPDATIADLRERLARTRWPDQIAAPWDHGTDLDLLRSLAGRWAEDFDWRAEERRLNALPHFRAQVDGFGLHFVHARGRGASTTPLMLLHGWPSTFLQMRDVIPRLTDPARFGGDPAHAFDVVVPSLPGFGFSDRPSAPGMTLPRIAELLVSLMRDTLGYGRFGVRASDIGAGVAAWMAMLAPAAVLGLHLNAGNPYIDESRLPDDLSDAERRMVDEARTYRADEGAYLPLQATKPQTLAYALHDSPVGMAGWIVEKLRAWSDCDGDLERAFRIEDVLTTLTIYWATQTMASSLRLYLEVRRDTTPRRSIAAPVGVVQPPHDMVRVPREWVERQMPVAHWTELPRGGHFPEWEVPELIAPDVAAFFASLTPRA